MGVGCSKPARSSVCSASGERFSSRSDFVIIRRSLASRGEHSRRCASLAAPDGSAVCHRPSAVSRPSQGRLPLLRWWRRRESNRAVAVHRPPVNDREGTPSPRSGEVLKGELWPNGTTASATGRGLAPNAPRQGACSGVPIRSHKRLQQAPPHASRLRGDTDRYMYRHMAKEDIRRVTANLPAKLLRKACEVTGKGVTDTLVEGLEMVRRRAAAAKLKELRGKIRLDIDLEASRERPGH